MDESKDETRQLVPLSSGGVSSSALSVEQGTSTTATNRDDRDGTLTDKNWECCKVLTAAVLNKKPITDWQPENAAFWESTGAAIARRNLSVSVPVLMLAYCTWVVW